MKIKRDREEPCYICGHYHDFEHGETCSTCGHVLSTTERKAFETVLPANILPGFLYLGSYDTASRSEMLKAMGVSHILNVSCVATGMHDSNKWRSYSLINLPCIAFMSSHSLSGLPCMLHADCAQLYRIVPEHIHVPNVFFQPSRPAGVLRFHRWWGNG